MIGAFSHSCLLLRYGTDHDDVDQFEDFVVRRHSTLADLTLFQQSMKDSGLGRITSSRVMIFRLLAIVI